MIFEHKDHHFVNGYKTTAEKLWPFYEKRDIKNFRDPDTNQTSSLA